MSRCLQACLDYVLGLQDVEYDPKHVVAAGVSNGGIMAAPMASRYPIYTHAMLIHARCGCRRIVCPFSLLTRRNVEKCVVHSYEEVANCFEFRMPIIGTWDVGQH